MIASVTKTPNSVLHLEVKPSKTDLVNGDTYDTAAVRIRVLDENNNLAPYAQLPLKLTLTGDAELLCPDMAATEGGMTGLYLRSLNREGEAELTVSSTCMPSVTVRFTIHKNN